MWQTCSEALLLCVGLVSSVQAQGPGGTIGVYGDSHGASHYISAPINTPVKFYVLAQPGLSNLEGLAAFDFRITGAPVMEASYLATVNPAAILEIGDPIDYGTSPSGCSVAFDECQVPDQYGHVLLYTITMTDLSGGAEVTLQVDGVDPPISPSRPYPTVYACDGPIFTPLEAIGLSAHVSRSVAIEQTSWGAVKQLY